MGSPPPDGTNDSCGRPESATMICSLLRSRTGRGGARLRHPSDGATVPPAERKLRRCPHSSTFAPPEAAGAQTTQNPLRVSSLSH